MPNVDLQNSVDRLATIAKKLADGKEPRKYDFSSTPVILQTQQNDGTELGVFGNPANFDKVPVGSEAKLSVKLPTNPADIPTTDDVQMTMVGTYLWINKAQTNVMNWGEVKTQLQAGKVMVIERIADTIVNDPTNGDVAYKTWQLTRWEDAPITGGGRPETIFGTTLADGATIDINFKDIMSASISYSPPNSGIMHFYSIPFVKSDPNTWTAATHYIDKEYIILLSKKADGKITFTTSGMGSLSSYSITYWKED